MPELSERDIKLVQQLVTKLKNASGPGLINGADSLGVIHFQPRVPLPPGDKWMWIRLTTDATGTGLYNARHQKVIPGPMENPSIDFNAANYFADVSNNDDCLFRNLAESGNPSGSHALTPGSLYILARRAPIDTTDSPAKPVYEMEITGIPNGEYQYSVYQMVSQNQQGFDYVRAHPLT